MNVLKMKVFKFSELDATSQQHFREKYIDVEIEEAVGELYEMCSMGDITEEQLYEVLGCSKEYAESTPWFVGSCFYSNPENKVQVDNAVAEFLSSVVFNKNGEIAGSVEECKEYDTDLPEGMQDIVNTFEYEDLLTVFEAIRTTDLRDLLIGDIGCVFDVSEEFMNGVIKKVDIFMDNRSDKEK